MLNDEIMKTKAKNWSTLVLERANKLCEIKKNEVDLPIQLLTGEIFEKAVDQIALEIQSGFYDDMLMPKECNL